MRRVDDVGLDLSRDKRQSTLFPGQPGWPVRDRWGPWDDTCARQQPLVSLLIGALTGEGEIGAGLGQRLDEAVDVAA
jgi:hypothetical protein